MSGRVSIEAVVGFELGVVSDGSIEAAHEVGAKERWSERKSEKVLQGFPETLDDGNGAGFADSSEALLDTLGTKPTTKNSGGELGSLV